MTGEPLSGESIKAGLETRTIGRNILYYPEVTSTNELAKDEAGKGAPEGTVLVAGKQTQGRGRLKRSWLTPEGNIALSVILYPDFTIIHSLMMLASLSVVYGIESVTGLSTGIKWPNDVLIDGRKVCGILIESDIRNEKVNHAVIGIGINVNIKAAGLAEVLTPATSLMIETGSEVSRLRLIRELLAGMDGLYLALKSGGSLFNEWKKRLVTLGEQVRVTAGNEVYEGIAESVDTDCSLLVRSSDGSLNRVIAGDVTLRR